MPGDNNSGLETVIHLCDVYLYDETEQEYVRKSWSKWIKLSLALS